MKKFIIAIMLLTMLPSTASAGLFDFLLKKKPESRQEAAKKRLTKAKERFQKKMIERRKNSSLVKRSAQKREYKARSSLAKNYVKKRSATYPAAPNR
jgi:hypothetical protein